MSRGLAHTAQWQLITNFPPNPNEAGAELWLRVGCGSQNIILVPLLSIENYRGENSSISWARREVERTEQRFASEQISAIKTQLTTLALKWIQFLNGSKIAWSFWFDDINKPIRRNIMSGSSESPGAMPMDAAKAMVLLQPCLKCWPQPGPVMILWLLAGEWFIRSLSAGLLSVRAIKARIIVSRVLGTICSTAAMSEMWPGLQARASLVNSFIQRYFLCYIIQTLWAASDTRSVNRVWWILSGANHPSWWLGRGGKLQFFNQTQNKMMDPPGLSGHSWHLTSWSWQWHPSRDRVLICQYKICLTNLKASGDPVSLLYFLVVSCFIRSKKSSENIRSIIYVHISHRLLCLTNSMHQT